MMQMLEVLAAVVGLMLVGLLYIPLYKWISGDKKPFLAPPWWYREHRMRQQFKKSQKSRPPHQPGDVIRPVKPGWTR